MNQDHHDEGVEYQRQADRARVPVLEDDGGTESAQSQTDRDQYSKINSLRNEIKRGEKWMIWLTGAMAIFALSTVIVGILQWNVMSRQLAEMHSSGVDTHNLAVATGSYAVEMKRLAEQTTSLATYSKTAADSAQRLEKSTNRTALQVGVVCEPALSLAESPPIGKTWDIILQIDNQYDRPASNVKVSAAAVMIDGGQTPNFNREKRVVLKGAGIPRQDQLRVPVALEFVNADNGRKIGPVTNDLFDSIKVGRGRLFVYGEVTYADAGGCHKQEFCRFFDRTMRTGGPSSTPTGIWMSCTTHFAESDCH